ncbi:anti-repressor SinI family protein [Virgibacillus sp. W0181]
MANKTQTMLDQEWVALLLQAKLEGISIEEVKDFLRNEQSDFEKSS